MKSEKYKIPFHLQTKLDRCQRKMNSAKQKQKQIKNIANVGQWESLIVFDHVVLVDEMLTNSEITIEIVILILLTLIALTIIIIFTGNIYGHQRQD